MVKDGRNHSAANVITAHRFKFEGKDYLFDLSRRNWQELKSVNIGTC